jgi:hypothetical protein
MAKATVGSSRFCEDCTNADRAKRYTERERARAEARSQGWRDWDRERQRSHHSSLAFGRRRSPARRPIRTQILALLEGVRVRGDRLGRLEEAKELVRQLAWGPGSQGDRLRP